MLPLTVWDTRWRSWLRKCAKNRKVAGSIPVGVTDLILPSVLWPWGQVRGIFPGGKGGRCLELTTLPPSYAWEPQHPGNLKYCPDLDKDCFTFTNEPIFWSYNILLHRCTLSSNHQLCFILDHMCKLYFVCKTDQFVLFQIFLHVGLASSKFLSYLQMRLVNHTERTAISVIRSAYKF